MAALTDKIDQVAQCAWTAFTFICHAELDELLENSVDLPKLQLVAELKSRNITVIQDHSDLVAKESLLCQKIAKKLAGYEFHTITDEQRWNAAAEYFESYHNRSFPFEACSEIKQLERLEELTGIFSDLVSLADGREPNEEQQ